MVHVQPPLCCASKLGNLANLDLEHYPPFFKDVAIKLPEKKGKAPKVINYNRDVICLPSSYACKGVNNISTPRGRQRSHLAEMGLQGKVTVSSDMTEEAVLQEIQSVFSGIIEDDEQFSFKFLQITGAGNKTLTTPRLSASFRWTAQEVSKLGKSCICIISDKKLAVENVKVSQYCV